VPTTYFGHNVNEGLFINLSGYPSWNKSGLAGFTCPGSGSVAVASLGAYVKRTNTGNVRTAIFTSAGAFVMQGATELAVDVGVAWKEHTTFVDQGGAAIGSPVLTGGAAYILCASADGSDVMFGCVTGSAGDTLYVSSDYTSGFPANLPGGASYNAIYSIRCGVDTGAAPASQPYQPRAQAGPILAQ
jgi:hypothetical protein